jgi:hypothetical protein
MQPDPLDEWRRITEHYREIGDGLLEELAAQFSDLTKMAQQILRDELRHRGMNEPGQGNDADKGATWMPPARRGAVEARSDAGLDLDGQDDGEDVAVEFTWKTLLCETETRAEAWQIYEMLRRAGIESWIDARASSYSQGLVNPRVMVAADQLDTARAIAAGPVPPDIVAASTAPIEEFELPRCPACGAEDPVLESAEPVNTWRCEACDAEWTDPAETADQEPQQA